MANPDDYGIISSEVQPYINPGATVRGPWLINKASGTGGVGGNLTYTVGAATWEVNEHEGFYLLVGNSYYQIVSNTPTVLTLDSNLTGASATWVIRARPRLLMTSTEFTTYLPQSIAVFKSRLPEKYRAMHTKIEGEILVKSATSAQTSATLKITPTTGTLKLYKNFPPASYDYRTDEDKMDSTLWSLSTAIVAFSPGLERGDSVFSDYSHTLPTPPPTLKALALRWLAYDILSQHGEMSEFSEQTKSLKEYFETMLAELKESEGGRASGIDYFDEIDLVRETRWPQPQGGYTSGIVVRG